MMDVPEDNNQHPEDIIEVSDDIIQDQHIEVAQAEPLKSQSSHISSRNSKQFLQVQGAGVVSEVIQELGIVVSSS